MASRLTSPICCLGVNLQTILLIKKVNRADSVRQERWGCVNIIRELNYNTITELCIKLCSSHTQTHKPPLCTLLSYLFSKQGISYIHYLYLKSGVSLN